MLPPPIRLSHEEARRFHRRLLRIDHPMASVGEALDYLGYVQIDPINVCGRMQDLILRNRVTGYAEGDLFRHLHRPERPGFEHHIPGSGVLVALPAAAWPYLLRDMKGRERSESGYGGRLDPTQKRLARKILAQIREEGPLSSDAIEHPGTTTSAWGIPGRTAKTVLDKLFLHGRVLISERQNLRRIYDLPEHVLPPEILNSRTPSAEETRRWTLLTRLRQRRLALLNQKETAVIEDLIQPLEIGDSPTVYCLRTDLPLLNETGTGAGAATRLVAPLDPLIYDRRLTRSLWEFDYTWEVYTPAAKRVRGYYALPLLDQTGFIGHVDLKAERKAGKLRLVSRKVAGRRPYAPAVRELATFLGLRYP
ncbi:MAG: crosslink repair DNA glycosylase YcaQ family protein [Opitutaceae bacterium]